LRFDPEIDAVILIFVIGKSISRSGSNGIRVAGFPKAVLLLLIFRVGKKVAAGCFYPVCPFVAVVGTYRNRFNNTCRC
jgi:hypothetical protein